MSNVIKINKRPVTRISVCYDGDTLPTEEHYELESAKADTTVQFGGAFQGKVYDDVIVIYNNLSQHIKESESVKIDEDKDTEE